MKRRVRVLYGSLVGALSGLVCIVLLVSGLLIPFENTLADSRFRAFAEEERWPEDVVVIYVDQRSLTRAAEELGLSWPWPRNVHGELAVYLRKCGARSVHFDLTFSEPSLDDAATAELFREAGNVHFASLTGEEKADRPLAPEVFGRIALPLSEVTGLERIRSLTAPVPELAAAAEGVCLVETRSDGDGVVRWYVPAMVYRDRALPSLGFSAYRTKEDGPLSLSPGRLAVDSLDIPLDDRGRMLLSPYGVEPFRPLSCYSVISWAVNWDGEGDPPHAGLFRDRHVLIGVSATDLKDIRATSCARARPGVDIHATALANLINGDLRRRGGTWIGVLWTFLLSGLIGASVCGFRLFRGVLLTLALGAVTVGGNLWFFAAGIWIDLAAPLLGVLLSFGAAAAFSYFTEGRRRAMVRRAFQQYVSPAVVGKILDRGDLLALKGERKQLTIFFLDFEGFTSASEMLEPDVLMEFLNEYHNEGVEEIFAEGGTLDKFIGDCIMAFWGDPVDQPDQAVRACRAALRIQKRLRALAGKMEQRGGVSFRARIGINTGVATVGNMGGRQVNYTVIGDEVNLASRIEGVNKEFGTAILITESTREAAGDAVAVRRVGDIRVKGRRVAVGVYELVGMPGETTVEERERHGRFETALARFRERKWDEADEVFAKLEAEGDSPSATYRQLISRFRESPPPESWAGEYVMEKK